jgi:hypothetical protein
MAAFNGSIADSEVVLKLRISDDTPAVFSTTFNSRQLTDPFLTEAQISRVYGDLLQYRSHKLIQHMMASSREGSRES